jgi:hypothetical protein
MKRAGVSLVLKTLKAAYPSHRELAKPKLDGEDLAQLGVGTHGVCGKRFAIVGCKMQWRDADD